MAILGSKGSGKKALLDVIACRANTGLKKGYVLLNGVSMNRRLFHVSSVCHLYSIDFNYLTGKNIIFSCCFHRPAEATLADFLTDTL